MKKHRYQFDFNPRKLADLPNHPGFFFRGIDEDGNTFDCIVVLDKDGCCTVHNKDGEKCFNEISAWLPSEGAR